MANLKFSVPVDPEDLTFGDFKGADIGDHNKKSFEITTPDGLTIDVDGSGFKYVEKNGDVILKSGDIHSIEISLGGNEVFKFSGIDLSVADLFRVASTETLADDLKLIQQLLSGKDNLTGSAGDDFLSSFGDADVLKGGAGNDILDGGKGNDVFVFGEAGDANADHIVTFGGKDRIDLASSFFSELTTDDHGIAKGTFVLGTAAVDANDHLIYDKATGKLFYDADGAGGDDQMLIAILDGKGTLGRDDFHLV